MPNAIGKNRSQGAIRSPGSIHKDTRQEIISRDWILQDAPGNHYRLSCLSQLLFYNRKDTHYLTCKTLVLLWIFLLLFWLFIIIISVNKFNDIDNLYLHCFYFQPYNCIYFRYMTCLLLQVSGQFGILQNKIFIKIFVKNFSLIFKQVTNYM